MSRRATDEQHSGLYILGCILAVGAFWSIPLVLARAGMPVPPPPAVRSAVPRPVVRALGGTIVFRDRLAQSRELIGYYHDITLTSRQEAVKKEVLGAMPAACCSGSTAYTCCCPCNLSKTIWGLSNFAIARHGADAKQLREAVDAWMAFVNPDGFRGNACYQGGCDSSISGGGCGAMKEEKLTV